MVVKSLVYSNKINLPKLPPRFFLGFVVSFVSEFLFWHIFRRLRLPIVFFDDAFYLLLKDVAFFLINHKNEICIALQRSDQIGRISPMQIF